MLVAPGDQVDTGQVLVVLEERTDDGRPEPPVRIANCSGFYGDRLSAARGDGRGRADRRAHRRLAGRADDADPLEGEGPTPTAGYATTFLTQMEQVLGTCVDRGIKVVTNAGGLNPAGLRRAGARHRRPARPRRATSPTSRATTCSTASTACARTSTNLDTGAPLTADPVSANAYLGGWGIAAALAEGADVVVCPRVTDAALVVGPAAWWWGWAPTDWDRLAGAVVAGHVIECGAQATGGNYAFFGELADLSHRSASRSPRSTPTARR